ncbi:MAG: TetR/AcrR family transcriptional regulator [Phycisphaerales bacterium]
MSRAPSKPVRRSFARETAAASPSASAASPRCDRAAILNAAEEVVLREGIGSLRLDAVAKEAKLSKSGLLHHFPSKEALIDALVKRKIDEWHERIAESLASTAPGPGRAVRSILSTCLSSTDQWTDAMRRSSMVLVAALVHDRTHVEPLRESNRSMRELFASDRLPAGVSDLVHLAVHGIWFDWIFELSDWTPQRLATVRSAIQRLLDAATEREPRAKKSPPKRSAGRASKDHRS